MASLIEDLFYILKEETKCYEELLNMADNKKDVIIKGDVPSLKEITKQEQEMAGQILRLENKRQQNLQDICEVTNKKINEMTISKLVDALMGKEKDELREINDRLVNVLQEFKFANETNMKLIQQSLDYIDFTVNAVQSINTSSLGNTYQSKGIRYADYQGTNFFDAKQ